MAAGDDVRRVVGLVADDAHVFASTLRANLALARPGAPDAELVAALRQARLGGWYDGLPEGLDTWLGQGGARSPAASGGGSPWPGHSSPTSPSWSWTSPLRAWTRPRPRRSSATCSMPRPGAPWCSLTHRTEGLDLVDATYELREGRLVLLHRAAPH